jgi:hypothetical protein
MGRNAQVAPGIWNGTKASNNPLRVSWNDAARRTRSVAFCNRVT